jgi:hypothetical protein
LATSEADIASDGLVGLMATLRLELTPLAWDQLLNLWLCRIFPVNRIHFAERCSKVIPTDLKPAFSSTCIENQHDAA